MSRRLLAARRVAVGAAAVALAALAAPGVAHADTPVTTTVHVTLAPDTFVTSFTCLAGSPGNSYEESITGSVLLHITAFPDGSETLDELITEDLVLVPVSDPSLPTYTGHATSHFEHKIFAAQSQTFGEVETAVLNGSDGTHVNAHAAVRNTIDSQGNLTVTFDRSNENVVC